MAVRSWAPAQNQTQQPEFQEFWPLELPPLPPGLRDVGCLCAPLAGRRLQLIADLSPVRAGRRQRVVDAFHAASTVAIAVGDLPAALTITDRAAAEDPINDQASLSALKLLRVLALRGDFDAGCTRLG